MTTWPMLTATEDTSGLTSSNTVILSGTVADDPSRGGITTLNVWNLVGGDTIYSIGDATIAADGTWSYTASGLADGTYNFLIYAYDRFNVPAQALAGPAVIVDTTGPALTAGESATGTTAATGVVLSGTVTDGAGVGAVEVLDTDGASWTDLGPASINGTTWQLTAGNLSLGRHHFVAIATDSLGNESSASAGPGLTVVQSTALVPAILRIVGNADGGVTLLGRAPAGSTVTISDTSVGVTRTLGSATVDGTGNFVLTSHSKTSTAAVNTFRAIASNAAGQTGDSSGLFELSSAGSDTLYGTAGQSDVFATFLRTGQDTISGFESTRAAGPTHDVINLSGTGYGSYAQLAPHIAGTSAAVIQLDATRSLTVLGVGAAQLQASDFRFS